MHRPNGDAYVYFNTFDDANEAMKCDRKYMGEIHTSNPCSSPMFDRLLQEVATLNYISIRLVIQHRTIDHVEVLVVHVVCRHHPLNHEPPIIDVREVCVDRSSSIHVYSQCVADHLGDSDD
jgi:hypothetical protein